MKKFLSLFLALILLLTMTACGKEEETVEKEPTEEERVISAVESRAMVSAVASWDLKADTFRVSVKYSIEMEDNRWEVSGYIYGNDMGGGSHSGSFEAVVTYDETEKKASVVSWDDTL